MPTAAPTILGVSLKMYFAHERSLTWMRQVAAILADASAMTAGEVEFFAVPSFPALKDAVEILRPHAVGAQDVAATDLGAYTGEVSAAELAEIGVSIVEVGHAERRLLFGEDDAVVHAKCQQVLGHGLTPLLCVGEPSRVSSEEAATLVVSQVRSALLVDAAILREQVVIAYEPHWAIGAPDAAPPDHVREVCRLVKNQLDADLPNLRLLYGGSAGPGTLTALGSAVDGLFLGRFAHDPANVAEILEEASARSRSARVRSSATMLNADAGAEAHMR